jgi:hypothetical protein
VQFPAPALRLASIAAGVDFGVGLVLTRVTQNYDLAVIGLVVGAACLLGLTTWRVVRLTDETDYLLFRLV